MPSPSPALTPASPAGLIQICLAGALWGTGGLVLELVREIVPFSVLTVSSYRMLIAAAVLVALLAYRGQLSEARVDLRTAAVGAATAIYQALYFAAVVAVGVTIATVVSLGIAPLLSLTGQAIGERRRPSVRELTVVCAALAGLVLVSTYAGEVSAPRPQPTLGILCAIGSGACFALTSAISRPLVTARSPLAVATGATAVGALILLPLGLMSGGPSVTLDPKALAYLAYLGLATMALAYWLLYVGLRTTPASAATVASLTEPVTAAAAAAAVLGERLDAPALLGIALVLGAIIGLA